MGGNKGKNKKRKNNEGEPVSPPPPVGYQQGGVLPTPSPTPSVATTTAALQQVTIEEDTETAEYWKERFEEAREAIVLLKLANENGPGMVVALAEEQKKVKKLEAEVVALNEIIGDYLESSSREEKRRKDLEDEVQKLKQDAGTMKMLIAGGKKNMLAHGKGMGRIQAAIDEYVPDMGGWEELDCPASGVVDGIEKLYNLWKEAEDFQRVVEEKVSKQYEVSFAEHKQEREEWKKELEWEKRIGTEMRKELEEKLRKAQRRPTMVDKGVRALLRPEVCSTLAQTDVAGVEGIKRVTWASVAAGGDSGGGTPPADIDVEMGGASPPFGEVAPCQSSG